MSHGFHLISCSSGLCLSFLLFSMQLILFLSFVMPFTLVFTIERLLFFKSLNLLFNEHCLSFDVLSFACVGALVNRPISLPCAFATGNHHHEEASELPALLVVSSM